MITLSIPQSWWESATPETRAAIRALLAAGADTRVWTLDRRHAGHVLALLLRDRRQARPARGVVERLERRERERETKPCKRQKPDPGTAKVVRPWRRTGKRRRPAPTP